MFPVAPKTTSFIQAAFDQLPESRIVPQRIERGIDPQPSSYAAPPVKAPPPS
jgi:hypothetical protein